MTEIPEGYQQTAIGIIPEDWEVKNLADVITAGPKNGYSGRSGRDAQGTLTLRLTATSSGYLLLNNETVKRLDETIDPSSQLFLEPGDVLIQRSNTYELVGTTAIFDEPARTYIYPDLMMRLRFEDQSTAHWFWRYANSFSGRRFFLSAAAGSTGSMPKISGKLLRGMTIPFPPLPEQKAIAQALSDVDTAIAELDRLITKKLNIKQGAMQQLLTGKKRLPGFTDEWVELNIFDSSILKARIGWQGLTTEEYLRYGEYFLVTGTDFLDGKIIWETCFYVNQERYSQDKNIQLKNEDVLITKDGTIGKVAYIDELPGYATLNSGIFVIRPKGEIYLSLYLYYVLKSSYFSDFLRRLQAGSTIVHLYQKDFIGFNFLAPKTLKEQKAIAQVLSDMDTEIEALEQKRDKYKAIKQGMMQELLTGRTRLL